MRDFQIEHVGATVTKPTFAFVFRNAWEQSINIKIAVKGYKDCGLFQFDVSQVLKTFKMKPSRIYSGTQSTSTSESAPESAQVKTGPMSSNKSDEIKSHMNREKCFKMIIY